MSKSNLFVLLAAVLVLASSCRKEGCTDLYATNYDPEATHDDGSCTIEGCTDPTAANYNAEATIDDASCDYQATVSFYTRYWWDVGEALYVDNQYVGTFTTYFNSATPSCLNSNTLTIELEAGLHTYRVGTWSTYNFTLAQGDCRVIEVQ